MKIRSLFFLFCALFSSMTVHADAWLSWSEFDEDGKNIQIYLSRETGSHTGPIKQITQYGMNISPALLATPENVWVAWVDRADHTQYLLHYARFDSHNQQLLESGTITTHERKVYAPALALTSSGQPVIAWSGLDKKDEEIRLAYYNKGRWGVEQQITENNFPDTSPVFTRTPEGELILSWEQIGEQKIVVKELSLGDKAESNPPKLKPRKAYSVHADTADRQKVRLETSIGRLPESLSARQHQFFMGSRAAIIASPE